MKIRHILLAVVLSLLAGQTKAQEFSSGPLIASTSGPYDIQGDSTLTFNIELKGDVTERKISGYFELWVIVDNENSTGIFASGNTSDAEIKPRIRTGYDTSADDKDLTWYTSNNDSVAAITNFTPTAAGRAFNYDFDIDECDGIAFEHDFAEADTMRVFYVFKYSGRK